MLLGEHAVLHGFRSVVCAIDRRIQITLTPLPEPVLEIESALGHTPHRCLSCMLMIDFGLF